MLNPTQLQARDGRLTASRVGVLMSGDAEKIMVLWEEMLGVREPEDLRHVWPVQLGEVTEALNLRWYELTTGRPLTRKGEVVVSDRAEWAASTLDGFDAYFPAPVECKHVSGFEKRDVVIARYQPQFHWQMICSKTERVQLSLIEGAREPVIEDIPFDKSYADELWSRAEAFMRSIEDLVPPVVIAPPEPPVPVSAMRKVDMAGNNLWASAAQSWLDCRAPAKAFDIAAKTLKEIVANDCSLAYGHGVQVKRNKAGSLSVAVLEK